MGSLNTFSLADARERALEQRKLLADGKDPLGFKRAAHLKRSLAEASFITFDCAATSYIASHKHDRKNEKHEQQWTNALANYANPAFGGLPFGQIETALVAEPMLNFKSFRAARNVLACVELMPMICKGQNLLQGGIKLSFADQFYALTGKIRPV